MPKNLTDVSQFNTIAVPVDTDAADAASVETPFQLLTDRTKYLIDYITGMRTSQWFHVEHDSPATWGSFGGGAVNHPHDICYAANSDKFSAIDDGGHALISKDPGLVGSGDLPGGQGDGEWQEEAGSPGVCPGGGSGIGAGHASAEIASNPGNNRVAVGDAATGGIVAQCSPGGAWTTRNTINSVAWHCVDNNIVFAIGGATGKIETSGDGVNWTNRASGISDTIRLIANNGDDKFMALSDTMVSVGFVTWSATVHGFTSTPLRMTYDAREDKWWVLRVNGSLAWSDDDGASWTGVVGDPLGLLASAPISKHEAGLDCDGKGNLVVTFERYTGTLPSPTTVDSRRWVVRDDGAEYIRTYSPRMHGCQQGGVCFGRDRFVTAGDVGGNFSLRVLEP